MNVKEWAAKLSGVEYDSGFDLGKYHKELKADGVIIAYGESDDLLEFTGACWSEVGAFEGAEVKIACRSRGEAFIFDEEENRDSAEFNRSEIAAMQTVKAIRGPEELDAGWLIETEIPHETFDIMEDGELFCRGVVFSVNDVKVVR
jgi:hypothetical protein